MALNPMTAVLVNGHVKTERRRGRRWLCEDGGRDWGAAYTNQGEPWLAGSHQELGERRRIGCPSWPAERNNLVASGFCPSSLQKWETIPFCHLKLPGLWEFLKPAVGN